MPDIPCAAEDQGRRKEADMNKQKITILYERLSVDDDRDGESNSIANQKKILEKYAVENGITNYVHRVDDGFSGVNFQRPAFQEMLTEVQAGNVSLCVVKDMSRFGRNYLQVGLYMELFEQHGVRIVAVDDGVDTSQGIDDFTPFRNILNEWYARDCSRKVKSALASKGREGKPLSAKPPYGYVKDPNDPNKWNVDEYAAAVVRRIYDLAIDGFGNFEICRILHGDKVERPSYYHAKNGHVNYKNALEADDPYLWCANQIRVMLSRLEYAGHIVNFRTSRPSFKSKRQVENPKEDWVIYENAHEAIIDRKTWDLVQQLRQTKRRTDTTGKANPLTGLLFCADCGKKLYNHRSGIDHYTCPNYLSGKQKFKEIHCSAHYVKTEIVNDVLLDIIKRTSGYAQANEAELADKIRSMSLKQQAETEKINMRQIMKNERRAAELDKLLLSIYEDKAKGLLPEKRYSMMAVAYEQEQSTLNQESALLQSELDALKTDNMKAENFLEIARRYTQIDELTPAMINEFVDKIIIHESVWSEQTETTRRRGTRTQEIEVFLKYIGSFDVPDMRSAEEVEADRIAMEKLDRKRKQKRESQRRRQEKIRAKNNAEDKLNADAETPPVILPIIPDAVNVKPKPAA
jgi:DNA invertase Pin-like site-specific DNA recombinase